MRLSKSSFVPTSTSLLVVALLLFPTSSLLLAEEVSLPPLTADSYWAWAEKKGTAQSYHFFLQQYPKDARAAMAETREAQLDFEQATKEGTRSALRRFQRLHPGSPLIAKTTQGSRLSEGSVGTPSDLTIYDKAMDKLCAALKDADRAVCKAAAEALGKIGDARVVDPLLIALKDADWRVRDVALSALGRIGDARALDPLVIALKDNDTKLRRSAVDALGQIGDSLAIDPLVIALKDNDKEVRSSVVCALGQIGDSLAIDPLVIALNDNDENVRRSVVYALGQIGDSRAIDPLVKALKDFDRMGMMRWPVAKALGEIGDDLAVDRLATALKDADRGVRYSAADVLGKMRNPRAVDPLVVALKDTDLRVLVARALGEIGDSRAVEPLVIALKDPNRSVRGAAAGSLGELGEARAVEPLVAALKDADWSDRSYIAGALCRIGDTSAADSLALTLKNDQLGVREAAAIVLGRFGDVRAVEPLVATLKDTGRHKLTRQEAAYALCNIQDDRAFDSLVMALKDDDKDVRGCAAEVLGIRGDAHAVDSLVAALEDVDREVGYKAAKALGKIRDDRAIDQLVIALNVGTPAIRGAALAVLAQIGDSHAVNPLVTVLKDRYSRQTEYFYVAIFRVWDGLRNGGFELSRMGIERGAQTMATKALAEIVMKQGIGVLKPALHDPDSRVRQGATAVLAKVAEQRQELLFGKNEKAEATSVETAPGSGQREPTILDKIEVAGSLAGAGDTTVLPKIKDGLKNPEIAIQCEAIDGLAKAKEQKPVAMACFKAALAETKSDTVRLKLTGELAKMQDQKAVADIKKYAKSEDPLERMYAADILGQTGKDGVADELAAALDDLDALVRVHAATAIIRTLQAQAFVANDSSENTGGTLMPSSGTKSEITK